MAILVRGPAGDATGQAPPVGVAATLGQVRHCHRDTRLILVRLDPPGWRCSGQHATDAPAGGHPPNVDS
jgi:hypothetical protein